VGLSESLVVNGLKKSSIACLLYVPATVRQVCEQYYKRVCALESEKLDVEFLVARKEMEVRQYCFRLHQARFLNGGVKATVTLFLFARRLRL